MSLRTIRPRTRTNSLGTVAGVCRSSCGEMTRSALPQWFADPERGRAADDRRDGQNAEITSVERVGGLRIQEEDFVLADDAATLPGRERTASAIVFARVGDRDGVDRDDEAVPANRLAGKGQHVLHERHAARQIIAVGQKALELLGGPDNDEIGYMEVSRPLDRLEADGDARARIPNQPGSIGVRSEAKGSGQRNNG
jgi:hypothetical protein